VQKHIAKREQLALSRPISEDEFEFAQQLVANDGTQRARTPFMLTWPI